MTKFIAWGQAVLLRSEPQPPENSLPIIDRAYELGYDGIELDLRLSKDGELVLMHDGTIDKTTVSTGRVADMTVDELKRIQLKDPTGGAPTYIATFTEALIHNNNRGYVMADMRHPNQATEVALVRAIEKAQFDARSLLILAYTPEMGRLYQEILPGALVMLKAGVSLKPPELNASFVDRAAGLGAVIAPIFSHPDLILEFRQRTRELGLKLGVYMHHQGVQKLREVVRAEPDFITSQNPSDFATIRQEFGLSHPAV